MSATLLVAVALRTPADPVLTAPGADKIYTGVVITVDTNESVFRVQGSRWSAKQFAYSDNCEITLLYSTLQNGLGSTTAEGLRTGEKVTVNYQDLHDVHIADRIEQQPLQFAGTVRRINLEKRRLTLRRWIADQRLNIEAGCLIILGDHKVGALTDIRPGDHVVVTYETPGGDPMAWQITRTTAPSLVR